jgi:hypothetical protein
MNDLGTLISLQSISDRPDNAASRPQSIMTPPPPPHALSFLTLLNHPKSAGATVWQNQNQDQLTGAKPSRVTTGLGVAGTHGPEGQAAFSYGRPLNRHPNRSRRRRGRRGFHVI